MMSELGFKDELQRLYKIKSIRHRISELRYAIKYGIERFWNGYDSRDLWAFNSMFKDRTISILERYKQIYHCLWWCHEGYDWSKVCEQDKHCGRYYFEKEQIEAIIDTLIFHLQMSDPDYCEKQLFGTNIYDDSYVYGCRSNEDWMKIERIRKQNQDLAMDLLKVLMDELWD